jgi:serine/threonine protein kinase
VEGSAQVTRQPERFGRYVLLDRIGVGGMAEVFRAVMPGAEGFRRTFVVKRILGSLSQSASFVEMFVREARILALLDHPSIVQVYDFGNVDGNYFLAMEYVRGRDLQAVLRRLRQTQRTCPPSIAMFVAREIAGCLGYAHDLCGPDGKALNLIHRDVSPSNIMCANAGGVKLLDFGIAKVFGDDPAERTERGAFKGKLAYMAPERVKREPIDGRSDLFSLGVVMWEMLTGRRLFRGANDLETLRNVLEAAIPLPSSIAPDVPPGLDGVVMRALARDPAARYASGHELADELEELLQGTKHNSKVLPALLRDLFGAGLQSGPLPLSGLAEELIDATAGTTTGRSASHSASQGSSPESHLAGLQSGPIADKGASEELIEISAGSMSGRAAAAPETSDPARAATLAPEPSIGPRPTAARARPSLGPLSRISAAACAAAGTAALIALLVGRGGGGRSNATPLRTVAAHEVAPASPAPTVEPVAPPAAAPAEPAAPAAPEPPAAEPAAAATPPVAEQPAAAPGHRPGHSRVHTDRDRITRGLSIDPFADAPKRGHR